jgi:hypothetical protein
MDFDSLGTQRALIPLSAYKLATRDGVGGDVDLEGGLVGVLVVGDAEGEGVTELLYSCSSDRVTPHGRLIAAPYARWMPSPTPG